MKTLNLFQYVTRIICSILVIGKVGSVWSLVFPHSIRVPAGKITPCTSTFQSFSSLCSRESKHSHFLTHSSTSSKLPTTYLRSSDEVGNETSNCHWKILRENHFVVRSWLIGLMGMVKELPTTTFLSFVGFIIFVTIVLFPGRCAAVVDKENEVATLTTTTTNDSLKRTSRYWSMMQSSDPIQIITANERLLDHAVGTINTMYYDNSGGADFSPKDIYDRWKVLRTYAKEGIEGVKVINNNEALKQKMRDIENEQLLQSNSATKKPFYGNGFSSQLFSIQGDSIKLLSQSENYRDDVIDEKERTVPSHAFDSRENAVTSLKWLVSTIGDPYSKYLTREELREELQIRDGSFLGLGVIVEAPPRPYQKAKNSPTGKSLSMGQKEILSQSKNPTMTGKNGTPSSAAAFLTSTRVANLPIVTAIIPDSPAERAGLVVGDRFAAIGSDNLVGLGRDEIIKKLKIYTGAENYIGYPDITVTKPILRLLNTNSDEDTMKVKREEVIGYKLSRVRLPTTSVEPFKPYSPEPLLQHNSETLSGNPTNKEISGSSSFQFLSGGDSIVHYELLTPDDSIFRRFTTHDTSSGDSVRSTNKDYVGYIRITRFSRSATVGYVNAVSTLEKAGAQSYIIDVRNNYGGVIQEAMLTASSLIRDPHAVLCYTMNSRGGFTPHDVEEYVVDKKYPGYLLSTEKSSVTLQQVKRDNPEFLNEDGSSQWYPPSSYASLREQRAKRGIRPVSRVPLANAFEFDTIISSRKNLELMMKERKQLSAQKNIVLLVNEGTASAAEVFVSSLHDNGRTVATIGSRTFGKGLIQHTFPMPDGGGLRLTVAEYLTPSLQHVTKVGNARYDPWDDNFVRGGIRPDIYCQSKQGIPSNAGADICVGIALDALEGADVGNFEEALPLNPFRAKQRPL